MDLELGVAALGRGADVGETLDRVKSPHSFVGETLQKLDVEASDLDLDRGLETKVRGSAEAGDDRWPLT